MEKSSQEKIKTNHKIGVRKGDSVSSLDIYATRFSQKLPDDNYRYYLAFLLSLAAFMVYFSSLRNEFVWDDGQYVFDNPHIRSFDLTFLKWAFFDFYAANWHPLTWISHALDYAVWERTPIGHHLTNIALHSINTFLVVLLTVRLLEIRKERTITLGTADFVLNMRGALIAGGITGLLFGVHPVHVESVAWVAERKDLLCALFFIFSVTTYTKYISKISVSLISACPASGTATEGENPSFEKICGQSATTKKSLYLLSLGFFALALLSKPMAVSLPIVLLILDWYPFERIRSVKSFWSVFIEKLPFFVLALLSAILTVLAQNKGGAMGLMAYVPLSIRLLLAAKSLISYLWMMIWPIRLVPFYPYPDDVSLSNFEYFAFVILTFILTLTFAFISKKNKFCISAWAYYIITLLPVLGIIQVGTQSMADRYTYLPGLAPFLVVGVCVAWGLEKTNGLMNRARMAKALIIGSVIIASLSLTYLTVQQIKIWRNSFSLWDYIIDKEPGKIALAYYNRGYAYDQIGRPDKAIEDFNTALILNPSYIEAYNNRGMAFQGIGQFNDAVRDFDKAIELDPSYYQAYANMGMVYGQIGSFAKAIEAFDKAISIMPNFLAYSNRGLAYYLVGEYERSLSDLNKTIELNNAYPDAYGTRGNVYLKTEKIDLAILDFQKACDLGDEKGCAALQAVRR